MVERYTGSPFDPTYANYQWVHTGIFDYIAGGMTVMAKYGSEFISLWNAALPAVLSSQAYKSLCDSYRIEGCYDVEGLTASEPVFEKVYTIAVGLNFPPYDFIGPPDDTASNKVLPITGFSNELALVVCEAAGVKCQLVFDDYDNCWGAYDVQPTGVTIQGWEVNAPESSTVGYTYPVNYDGDAVFPEGAEGGFVDLQYPGDGIMQGRYDACVGWTHTWLRQNSVEFGDAVVTTQPGGILAAASTIEIA